MEKSKVLQQIEIQKEVIRHQIWLRDPQIDWNGEFENKDCYDTGIGIANGVVGITDFARCEGFVPVLIELHDKEPAQEDINDYNGVLEASLVVSTGKILVENSDGETEINVPNGAYRVRIYYGGEETGVYDKYAFADHVRIVLYPQKTAEGVKILKNKDKKLFRKPLIEYVGSRSENELVSMIVSPIISYRCIATVAMLKTGKQQFVQSELSSAPDSVKRVFASAIWLVGKEAIPTLSDLSQSKDANIRLRAAQSLRFLKSEELVSEKESEVVKAILLKLTKDEDSKVKDEAEQSMEFTFA